MKRPVNKLFPFVRHKDNSNFDNTLPNEGNNLGRNDPAVASTSANDQEGNQKQSENVNPGIEVLRSNNTEKRLRRKAAEIGELRRKFGDINNPQVVKGAVSNK